MEDQSTAGGGGIDLFGEGTEPYSPFLEIGDDLNQMLQGATKAIESPDNERVSLPYREEGVIEPWSALFGAGDDVGMDRLTPCRLEGVRLQIEGLFSDGDAGIANVHVTIVRTYQMLQVRKR